MYIYNDAKDDAEAEILPQLSFMFQTHDNDCWHGRCVGVFVLGHSFGSGTLSPGKYTMVTDRGSLLLFGVIIIVITVVIIMVIFVAMIGNCCHHGCHHHCRHHMHHHCQHLWIACTAQQYLPTQP